MKKSSEFRNTEGTFLTEKLLPFGLYNPLATGLDGQGLVRASKDKAREEKAGNISSRSIHCGGEKYQRTALTQAGIMRLLNQLDSLDPLRRVKIEKMGIRNGLNAAQTKRLIRMADAQSFFSSAGVANIHNAIVDYSENPFITSVPNKHSKSNGIPFYQFVQEALVDYTSKNSLADPVQQQDMALFLPATCHTLNELITRGSSGKLIHSKCNSIGFLVDFINSHLYIVFKSLEKDSIYWTRSSYEALLSQLVPYAKKWGIRNVDSFGFVIDAIVLCETRGEMEKKAAYAQDMAKPFQHIYPIVMKSDGMELLRSLLTVGANRFRELEIEQAKYFIYHVSEPKSPSILFPLLYNGKPLAVATTIDYVQIADIMSVWKYEKNFFVACWEDQVEFYMYITEMPETTFVPILRT